MKRLKVGVVGAGVMGTYHLRNYAQNLNVELIGLADVDEEKAKHRAAEFGIPAFCDYRELLGKVDAISIASISSTHGEIGEFFLSAGVHCLIEKPLALTPSDCARLGVAAEKGKAKLLVGHIERFNPAFLKLEEFLQAEGGVSALHFERFSPASSRICDASVVEDLMVHDIDLALALMGDNPRSINAGKLPVNGKASADYVRAHVRFAGGELATLTASRIGDTKARVLKVICQDIAYELDFSAQSLKRISKGETENIEIVKANQLQSEQEHFISCVQNDLAVRIPLAEAVRALEVVWSIEKQLKEEA